MFKYYSKHFTPMNIGVGGDGSIAIQPDTSGPPNAIFWRTGQCNYMFIWVLKYVIYQSLRFCLFVICLFFLNLGIFFSKLLPLSIFGSFSLSSCTFLHLVTHRFVCNFGLHDVQLGRKNGFSGGWKIAKIRCFYDCRFSKSSIKCNKKLQIINHQLPASIMVYVPSPQPALMPSAS
jgi:hypothetical protein